VGRLKLRLRLRRPALRLRRLVELLGLLGLLWLLWNLVLLLCHL
jgi:hypothetical protein